MKLIALVVMLLSGMAQASNRYEPPDSVDTDVTNTVNNTVESQPVTVEAPTSVEAPTTVQISGSSYPRQVPEQTLFINNSNLDNCIRVLGFSFARDNGSGMLGIPIPRDRSCDVWRAVNEAQENGHVMLSYAFMCEIKNIKKVWGLERCSQMTTEAMTWLEQEYSTLAGSTDLVAEVDTEKLERELEATKHTVSVQQVELERVQRELKVYRQRTQQEVMQEIERRDETQQRHLEDFLRQLEERVGTEDG